MNVIKTIPFFLVSLSLFCQSFTINKWSDNQGKISFQDKPCPELSELSVIKPKSPAKANGVQSVNNLDIKVVDENLTNGRTFLVGVPSDWQDSVQLGGGVG